MTLPHSCYAVTAPGLESLTAWELELLGLRPRSTEPGGIEFEGNLHDVARANLWLRTASRVLVRLGQVRARALGELERKVANLPWSGWLPPDLPLSIRATCRKSRLFHQRAVAERILAASGHPGEASGTEGEGGHVATQLVVVRMFRDECTVSLDSSGELLHRRGYRLETAKAPVRETLAAGLLLASGWQPDRPLVDPFCGSGTIPIEAAMIARRLAPGRHRTFSAERWQGWDASGWATLLNEADALALPRAPAAILGADRDEGAIRAARANAERAGVMEDVIFRVAPLSALDPPEGPGALVSNPPYGLRIGGRHDLRDLYARLGQVARERLAGWRVALLLPADPLELATGLPLEPSFRSLNGGVKVRAMTGQVPRHPDP